MDIPVINRITDLEAEMSLTMRRERQRQQVIVSLHHRINSPAQPPFASQHPPDFAMTDLDLQDIDLRSIDVMERVFKDEVRVLVEDFPFKHVPGCGKQFTPLLEHCVRWKHGLDGATAQLQKEARRLAKEIERFNRECRIRPSQADIEAQRRRLITAMAAFGFREAVSMRSFLEGCDVDARYAANYEVLQQMEACVKAGKGPDRQTYTSVSMADIADMQRELSLCGFVSTVGDLDGTEGKIWQADESLTSEIQSRDGVAGGSSVVSFLTQAASVLSSLRA